MTGKKNYTNQICYCSRPSSQNRPTELQPAFFLTSTNRTVKNGRNEAVAHVAHLGCGWGHRGLVGEAESLGMTGMTAVHVGELQNNSNVEHGRGGHEVVAAPPVFPGTRKDFVMKRRARRTRR